VFAVAEPERSSRVRELRIAARLMLGPCHPVVAALADAIVDPAAIGAAVDAIAALPALTRRRLLSALAAVLPTCPRPTGSKS
jgi:hypothetical protein